MLAITLNDRKSFTRVSCDMQISSISFLESSSLTAHAGLTYFSVSPQSRYPFSASFQTFCLTARAYLNTQKYAVYETSDSRKIHLRSDFDWFSENNAYHRKQPRTSAGKWQKFQQQLCQGNQCRLRTVFIVSARAVTTIFLRRNILLTFAGLKPHKNRCFKFFGETYRVKLKCDVEDGMPSKACRPCYDKIMKFKKFKENSENSTEQHRSMIRFKRCMSKGDSPLLISSGHARSGKNEVGRIRKYQGASSESSSRTSRARVSLFSSTVRPIYLPHQFQCQNR